MMKQRTKKSGDDLKNLTPKVTLLTHLEGDEVPQPDAISVFVYDVVSAVEKKKSPACRLSSRNPTAVSNG